MLKIFFIILISSLSVSGMQGFSRWLQEGQAYGKVRYYYIQTDKKDTGLDTSAKANAIGGQLGYKTASLYGLEARVTFMTTNGFLLPERVDTSILGKDRGVVCLAKGGSEEECASLAKQSFSVLGEALVSYRYKNLDINYGRQVVKTPLIHAKEVRMLPTAVLGSMVNYRLRDLGFVINAGYFDKFKQRTSDEFMDMYRHALGDLVEKITGKTSGDVYLLDISMKQKSFGFGVYDYYASDFLNSVALNGYLFHSFLKEFSIRLDAEGFMQNSIGNADTNLEQNASLAGGPIEVQAFSFKVTPKYKESTLLLAYSYVKRKQNKHDSLVLPWDGTPLFTNTITSNDLFQSLHGKGLEADSAYIGGTKGYKISYVQGYDFSGLKGFYTTLTYALFTNSLFPKDQSDVNVVFGYKKGSFALAFKGIFVKNNTATADNATSIKQLDTLNQYRVIATLKF